MDLTHDWKTLNEVLFEKSAQRTGERASLFLLMDQGKIIDGVVSSGAFFADQGASCDANQKPQLDALAAKYDADETLALEKAEFDQHIIEAGALGTNYYQQLQLLRAKLMGQVGQSGQSPVIVSRKHFVLDFFSGWVRKLLPRRFNVLVFVDDRNISSPMALSSTPTVSASRYRALLLSYSKGQLDEFFEPDFSSLHDNRLVEWPLQHQAVGQYLETRYMLPCYAIFLYKEDWERCVREYNEGRSPWRVFIRQFDQGRAAAYPIGFIAKTFLAVQRLIVYFKRQN